MRNSKHPFLVSTLYIVTGLSTVFFLSGGYVPLPSIVRNIIGMMGVSLIICGVFTLLFYFNDRYLK
ncbi:hypothetical protein KTT_18830 [Tengunoibacter tsumagoiensis]|uniref:Uncharacterized protein n=1 Tax=Tengunoibacter tsumagoiensis TaxID=2014871 RepID=A0A401ZYU1_9CHLR|nr:hypothetical protein KTT_18830 [Tengunoibacter tsumagoiensis]